MTKCGVIGLLWLCTALSFADDRAIAKAQDDLQVLTADIARLQAMLEQTEVERGDIKQALLKSESAINQQQQQIQQLQQSITEGEQRLKKYRQQSSKAQAAKLSQEQVLGKQIKATYAMPVSSPLQLLLNLQEPSLYARMYRYFDYLQDSHQQQITQYQQTIQTIKQLRLSIDVELDKSRSAQTLQDLQLKNLNQQRKKRQIAMRLLQRELDDQEDQLSDLQQQQTTLEELLAKLKRGGVYVPLGDFAQQSGSLPWPVTGALKKTFGSSRAKGKLRWRGLVLTGQVGDPVQAVHQGRVIFADYLRGFGLMLIIDHGKEYWSLYAHNDALWKEVGETVQTGEQIASVGNSGGLSQAGLYFELRHKGQPVDPVKWFVLRG